MSNQRYALPPCDDCGLRLQSVRKHTTVRTLFKWIPDERGNKVSSQMTTIQTEMLCFVCYLPHAKTR